jgi:N-acetylglutamate synthase-like GNAT family acetyltransferase
MTPDLAPIEIEIVEHAPPLRDAVVAHILAIQRDEFGFDIAAADQPDLLDVARYYQTGAGGFWVALAAGEVVGTIALRDIGQRQGALRKMFVKATHRGRDAGVAARLLARLEHSAQAAGVREIFLGTTGRFRAAHRFYERNGFQAIDATGLPPAFPRMALDTRFYRRALDVA